MILWEEKGEINQIQGSWSCNIVFLSWHYAGSSIYEAKHILQSIFILAEIIKEMSC